MMNAYSELYLHDAKLSLAQFFSYLIDDCGYSPSRVWDFFSTSGYAELFETGNPGVISGMSGIELGQEVIRKSYGRLSHEELPSEVREAEFVYNMEKSPAYWAGWALAEYQWQTGRRFFDIFDAVPIEDIVAMYHPYHEMDITQFIDAMEERISKAKATKETKLKKLREASGLSQAELSKLSGVHLRSIQMYEQKKNDIDKAQGNTLYRLSRVLGCHVEDLLEDPTY